MTIFKKTLITLLFIVAINATTKASIATSKESINSSEIKSELFLKYKKIGRSIPLLRKDITKLPILIMKYKKKLKDKSKLEDTNLLEKTTPLIKKNEEILKSSKFLIAAYSKKQKTFLNSIDLEQAKPIFEELKKLHNNNTQNLYISSDYEYAKHLEKEIEKEETISKLMVKANPKMDYNQHFKAKQDEFTFNKKIVLTIKENIEKIEKNIENFGSTNIEDFGSTSDYKYKKDLSNKLV